MAAQSDRIVPRTRTRGARCVTGRRDVVVTHELTHVTVRASTTRSVPVWLSEGFADARRLRAIGTARGARGAGRSTGSARAGLPQLSRRDATSTPAKGQIAPAYGLSLLAVRAMRSATARRAWSVSTAPPPGPSRRAGREPVADQLTGTAFETVLGTNQDAFVADWRVERQASRALNPSACGSAAVRRRASRPRRRSPS